jgi:four helix bundle protein
MKSYKDLTAYQKAYDLTLRVYKATKNYPREEIYGLVSQMRRSAVSLPCNIAEGFGGGVERNTFSFCTLH